MDTFVGKPQIKIINNSKNKTILDQEKLLRVPL